MKVISIEDIRWGRRDIKTVQLLASSLAKQTAKDMGVDEKQVREVEGGV